MSVYPYVADQATGGASDPSNWDTINQRPTPPTGWTTVDFKQWAGGGTPNRPTQVSVIYSRTLQAGDTQVVIGGITILLQGAASPGVSATKSAVAGDFAIIHMYGENISANPWNCYGVLYIFHSTNGTLVVGQTTTGVNAGTTISSPGYTPPAGKQANSVVMLTPTNVVPLTYFETIAAAQASGGRFNQNDMTKAVPAIVVRTGVTVGTIMTCFVSCYDSTSLISTNTLNATDARQMRSPMPGFPRPKNFLMESKAARKMQGATANDHTNPGFGGQAVGGGVQIT